MKLFLATAFASLATLPMAVMATNVIVENDFGSNKSGWSYKDNTHFDTNNGAYASGTYTNNKLQVKVGGVNGVDVKNGMSGGWEYDFTTTTAGRVEVMFDYDLTLTNKYESNEFGEIVVALDGVDVAVKRLTGKGGTYSASKSGEVVVFDFVPAGSHTVTMGAHNNQKTSSNEHTTVTYDYVKVTLEETADDLRTCPDYFLDFGGAQRGEYVTDFWHASKGIKVECSANKSGDDGRCRILDSSTPQGYWTHADASRVGGTSSQCTGSGGSMCGDPDLGSPNNQCNPSGPGVSHNNEAGYPGHQYENCEPRGNILVVDENGPNYAPDDAVGGTITFTFDYPTALEKVCYIDMDGAEDSHVDLYYFGGGTTIGIDTVVAGDNGYACTDLSLFNNVEKMVFRMAGSGSVSDIYYKMCDPTATTTTTTTTTTPATTTTTTSTTTTTTTTPATTTPATTTTTTTPTTTTDFAYVGKAGGGGGDPHFQRWGRNHDSFHGECDLVMVHSDKFQDGTGFDLHARTTIQDYFSFMETAAVRMGYFTMEMYHQHFFLNGVKMTPADLPVTFGDQYKYTLSNHPIEQGKNPKFYQYYKLDLDGKSHLVFKFYKQYLTISMMGHSADFADAVGLLGDYNAGEMLSRDGIVMADFDEFGFEWQVTPEDAHLFVEHRAPQLPYEQCRMPTANRPARRRLRGAEAVLFQSAVQACGHVQGSDFDLCTEDVMATGDLGLASVW